MQVNQQEVAALAQAEATPRVDMYAFIHKALRAYMVGPAKPSQPP